MPGDNLSTRNASTLQYARTALKGAAGVAALSPFPQLKTIFELAHSIVDTVEVGYIAFVPKPLLTYVQKTDKVEIVFANLAAQVCRTLRFIADTLRDKDAHTAKRLAGDLKELRE